MAPPETEQDGASEERFLAHLTQAGELISARRLEEAEVEVLRGLSVRPGERRALNLLALVRFKLGRTQEAYDAYREIAAVAPDDPGVRLNMGLLALKLDRFDEAVDALELAGRLQPGDLRVWSYLGFAYSRKGQSALAAAAFRRAGQEDLAAEIERKAEMDLGGGAGDGATSAAPDAEREAAPEAPPTIVDPSAASDRRTPSSMAVAPTVVAPAPRQLVQSVPVSGAAESGFGESPVTVAGMAAATVAALAAGLGPAAGRGSIPDAASCNLATFALTHLLPAYPGSAAIETAPSGVVRVRVRDEAYVRADAAVAHSGHLAWEPGLRRVRGRLQSEPLGAAGNPLYRLRGSGEVWVALGRTRLVALALDDDMLYVREERVVAFDGDVAWEAGRLPGNGVRLVQFRGRGQVAIEVAGDPVALKLEPERPVQVTRDRMLGWIGRVQPRAVGPTRAGAADEVWCDGEGVVLLEIDRDG